MRWPERLRMKSRIAAGLCLLSLVLASCAATTDEKKLVRTVFPEPQLNCDLKFANYGKYLSDLLNVVQLTWNHILMESRRYPKAPSHVSVKFRLDQQGHVAQIVAVEGDSDELGEKACVRAITVNKSYGAWTPPMIAELGDSQELTVFFYYAP